jgi:hypothetical protein
MLWAKRLLVMIKDIFEHGGSCLSFAHRWRTPSATMSASGWVPAFAGTTGDKSA